MKTYKELITSAPCVLVEFYASWCPHCQRMMPVVDDVKALLEGEIPVIQLDIEKNEASAEDAGVSSIPTFLIYKEGKPVWSYSGEIDGNALYEKIRSIAG